MDPKPPNTPLEQQPILTFEELSNHRVESRHLRHNNFWCHFIDMLDKTYVERWYYKKFALEQRVLNKLLHERIEELDASKASFDALKILDKEFYEAYKIMRGYGVSYKELFG